jgi:O-antigen/teichoic acid export membrane protein
MIVQRTTERLKAFAGNSRKGIADVLVSLVPQASKSLLGFLSSILLARGLGPGGMGQYALVQSISDTVTSLADPGVSQTAIRYASIAAARGDSEGQLAVIRWAFRLRLLAVLGMSAVLFFVIPSVAERLWHSGGLSPLMRIGLLGAVFLSLGSVPVIYFQSLKRFGMNAVILTGQGVISFGGVAVLALLGLLTVERVVVVMVAAAGLAALLACVLIPRRAMTAGRSPAGEHFSLRSVWRVPRSAPASSGGLEDAGPEEFAFYLLLSTVIVMITVRLDLWLMGVYLEPSQIGLYNIASRTALPLMFLLTALSTALWPRASAVATVLEVQALLRKTLKVSVLVSVAGVAYAIVVPLLIPVLFGDVYAPSVLLAQIISLGYCIAIMANPMTMVGYSFGMARIYWVVNLLQMVIVLALLVLLLPRIGVLGAAMTFVANNLVGGLINGYLVLRKSRTLVAAGGGKEGIP